MKKFGQGPRRETVRGGIVRWVCVVLAPFILLLIALNVITYLVSAERVTESLRNMLQLQAYGVDGQLGEMENSVQRLCGDNTYYLLVLQNRSSEMDTYLSRQELYLQMKRYALASSTEEALFLFAPQSGQFLMEYPESTYTEFSAVRDFLEQKLSEESARYAASWRVEQVGDDIYTLYLRKVYGLWVGSCVKISSVMSAMLDSQPDLLRETQLFLEMDGASYRVREDGTVTGEPAGAEQTGFTVAADGPSQGFRLVLRPRYSMLAFSGQFYIWVLLFLSAALLGFLPLFLGKISRKVTAPIKELEDAMKRLQKGNFETQLQTECNFQEMEEIKDTFNEMTRRIKVLKNDVYEEKLLRQKTESDFLQMQVKPHFYLNSLNQVHILAEMGDVETISQLSCHLVQYFRYLLRADQRLVPLEDELAHIGDFLYIQKLRYPAGFHYACRVGPGLERLLLPPLLLLTFVENSLKYALGVYGGSSLSITAEETAAGCEICVEDSGQGFPSQVLENLAAGREIRAEGGRACIGISNARQRLLFAFGERASIHFSNDSALGGAKVLIKIPMGREGEAL